MTVTRFRRVATLLLIGVLAGASIDARAGDGRLVVHEWGTFTCLQNADGVEMTGINIDDEPVPKFVHNLAPFINSAPFLSNLHWQYRQKAAPRYHPLVSMRLETPVLYFYPPEGATTPLTVDVSVRFRGGWLTEFYPEAEAEAPGLRDGRFEFQELTPQTVGALTWKRVQVGTSGQGPETSEHVWLAPRQVAAANLTAASGESERYLFYRGVGRLRAPLCVRRGESPGRYELFSNFDEVLAPGQSAPIAHAWLVEVNEDGQGRYRRVSDSSWTAVADPKTRIGGLNLETLAKPHGNMARLHDEMHAALVSDGLYADEATAMLSTWQRAYFKSPGQRLFFLVPRVWTDHYLPLELSTPADVNRVMMARIELVTHRQEEILAELAQTTPSRPDWIAVIPQTDAKERFLAGRIDFGDLGVEIPADYRLYLQLGRFRNALLVEEERRTKNENLRKFISHYGLEPFRVK